MTRAPRDPFTTFDPFRLYVFVPAIMSAGLLFSLATLVRDAVARRDHRRAERRTAVAAHGTVNDILGTSPSAATPPLPGLQPRFFYAGTGLAAGLAAAYLLPGSILNYLRTGGYVADIAWLLCLSLIIGAALAVVAAASFVVAATWPHPPTMAHWLVTDLSRPALTTRGTDAEGPTTFAGVTLLAAVASLTFVTLGVAVGRFRTFDVDVAAHLRELDLPWMARTVAGIGSTPVALLVATAVDGQHAGSDEDRRPAVAACSHPVHPHHDGEASHHDEHDEQDDEGLLHDDRNRSD